YYTSPIGVTVTAYNINGVQIAQTVLAADNGASDPFSLTVAGCTGAQYSAGCVIAYVTFSDGGVPDSLTIGQLTLTDAATPEPATLAMFGTGLLGLAGAIRARRKLARNAGKAAPVAMVILALVCTFGWTSKASATSERLITSPINNTERIVLGGNTRPETHNSAMDHGKVPDNFDMGQMFLQLKRSEKSEAALEKWLDSLQNPHSANFHKYMDAAEYARTWGVSDSDINILVSWLKQQGFKTEGILRSTMVIYFTGTAEQVHQAFEVEEHFYQVNGEQRYANIADPSIPAALEHVVVGVVGLNNFRPHMMAKKWNPKFYTGGSSWPQAVVPNDLETIHNAMPLFQQGITGAGQTIVVLEDTNIYNPPTGCTVNSTTCAPLQPGNSASGDLGLFRNVMGLSKYDSAPVAIQGTNVIFNQLNPGTTTSTTCTGPSTGSGSPGTGVNADSSEAAIDVEYAAALAPGANIVNAACGSGFFGGLTALQNILTYPGTPGNFSTCPALKLITTAHTSGAFYPTCLISMSYGEDEARTGATNNAAFNTAFQTAVGLGVTIFVSSGDEGAASRDADLTNSTHGISVSGWTSSPYAVSVGGTDYADEWCSSTTCANFVGTSATYWNNYNNVWYGSAKGYVPELPWADSCASVMLSTLLGTAVPPVGASSECNVASTFRTTGGGSGGPSGCATGTASTSGVTSGTCKGWPKPTFQSNYIGVIPGMTNDGVRDLPDISAFAANGLGGHLMPACYSLTPSAYGGFTCGTIASPTRPINQANTTYWWIGGGTSFSSPIMAGMQALVNQYKQSASGQATIRYYAMAANGGSVNPGPYGSSVSNCNSSLGTSLNPGCIFQDATLGDMAVNCTGTNNCYIPSSTYGVLNTGAVTTVNTQPTCTGCTTATTFSCTIAGPSNLGPYKNPAGTSTLYAGGSQATCSVTSTSASVLTLTITAGGAGYASLPLTTVAITGGPGTMGTQPVVRSVVSSTTGYQPAYPAITGYDLATGIGSPNAYNLVLNY
ncbi:MAG TPA: protease pro-enzyme activation domain-containing protein, partial [Terriglobales bacterium]